MRTLLWIVTVLALALSKGGVAGPGPAAAAPFNDPFLERFRVGGYASPEDVPTVDGWPVDLFAPLQPDSLWLASAGSTLRAMRAAPDSFLASGFLKSAGEPADSVAAWLGRRERLVARLAGVLARGGIPAPPASGSVGLGASRGSVWMLKESLYCDYQSYWDKRSYYECRDVVSSLLARAGALGLSREETFVWSLRLRRLEELTAGPAAERGEPWPEMRDLGPYDAQSAWAVWVACRRGLRRPLVLPGAASAELAAWLLRLRRTWLTETDLEIAGFPEAAEAALGALCLESPRARDGHFARYPRPPREPRFQEAWLRGRLRGLDWSSPQAKAWAAAPEVEPGLRRQLWRRASEEHCLRGEWDAGLAALDAALAVPAGSPGIGEARRRTLEWAHQAAVLAHARGLDERARRLLARVGGQLAPGERAAWDEATAALAAELAGRRRRPEPGATTEPDSRARQTVLAGRAGAVVAAAAGPLPRAWDRYDAALWTAWANWGVALAAAADARHDFAARSAYGGALAGVAALQTPGTRRALAVTAAARLLKAADPALVPSLGEWLLEREAARAAGLEEGPALPLRRLPGGAGDPLRSHALLGLCLAAGDVAGQLVLARDLPAPGEAAGDRLLLTHPVPAAADLRAALTAAPVDAPLILAVIRNESLFDPMVRSRAGALGWLQIMPFHYPERGLEGDRPRWNRAGVSLAAGVRLLAEGAQAFGGDPYRTAAAYNAGAGAVRRWDRQLGAGAAPEHFLVWIGYPETRQYVENVLIDREIYAWILAGRLATSP